MFTGLQFGPTRLTNCLERMSNDSKTTLENSKEKSALLYLIEYLLELRDFLMTSEQIHQEETQEPIYEINM